TAWPPLKNIAYGMSESYSFEWWERLFQPTWNEPIRVGVRKEPNRTSVVRSTLPSTTQRSLRLLLSMHSARPVTHRGSSLAEVSSSCLGFGGYSSAWVGLCGGPTRFSPGAVAA